jgi:3-oxoacyl-[acyl-carrier-protein] synthase-3
MAFLEFRNVRIAGISAGVPENVVSNYTLKQGEDISVDYTPEAFVEATGVKERRCSETLTTGDLCFAAAEKLIAELGWNKSDIEALVFVSQTADYFLPATACIIQDRLGLPKECYAEDVALGCSGWVYGLSNVASLVASGAIRKALLLAGDAKKRSKMKRDPLFGDAGTATAIEYAEGETGFKFHFGTDGRGYDAIIAPDGGSRNQVSPQSFELKEYDGKMMHSLQTHMKGMDVFSFGITTAPKSVKKLAEHFGFDYMDANYIIFHQANMKMNNQIVKKLKLDPDRVPSCMYRFGNTSSASIPLTIVGELKGKFENKPTKFICCGFGVGLSWGTVALETNDVLISDLVEVKDNEDNYGYKL